MFLRIEGFQVEIKEINRSWDQVMYQKNFKTGKQTRYTHIFITDGWFEEIILKRNQTVTLKKSVHFAFREQKKSVFPKSLTNIIGPADF